ncbi:MAG: hypothetical protein HRT87_09510 [Legionellales bacterium]|nr:hypothetical protein [Legionellales bacterium]
MEREIEQTFIIEYKSFGNEKRFAKAYLSNGRYFIHQQQGAIIEVEKATFQHFYKETYKLKTIK